MATRFVCIYKYIYGQGKGGVLPPGRRATTGLGDRVNGPLPVWRII